MNKISLCLALVFCLALGAAGCGSPLTPGPQSPPGSDPTAAPTTHANPTATPQPPEEKEKDGYPPAVSAARKALADRLGIALDDVSVVESDAVDWPDSSLGCPQPGYDYLQVITPGYRVILEALGQRYDYRTDDESHAVACGVSWPAEAQALVDQAVADASQRSGAPSTCVQVLAVEAVDWADGCLSCASEKEACPDVITPGYRLILQARGRVFEYHTDERRIVFCGEGEPTGAAVEAMPLVKLVTEDLAGRLGIPVDEVSVVLVEKVEWPDSSMGCPQPGFMYLQVVTPGYRIVLYAQGQAYDYHTDSEINFVLCGP